MNALTDRIRQVAITVSDVQRALAFYRDALGLPFLFAPSSNLAFLQAGEVRLMLTTPEGAGAVGVNSILYFSVTNIESAYDQLARSGVAMDRKPHVVAKMPDHMLWLAFVRDPDGNLVGLMEERR